MTNLSNTTRLLALAGAAVLAAGIAAPAAAQDGYSWTGPYIGARLGYSWQPNDSDERLLFDTNRDGSFNDTVRTAAGADAFSPGFCGGQAVAATRVGCIHDRQGTSYSGHLGFDYQLGSSLVVGVVGEYGNATVKDSVSGFSTTPASYSLTRTLRGMGTLRARAGFAINNTLIYGTGGGAYGRVRTRFGTTNNANAFVQPNGSDARNSAYSDNRYGYTFGGGIEQRVARNFSIGALFLHTSLSDHDYKLGVRQGTAPATNPFRLVSSGGTDLKRQFPRFGRQEVTVTTSFRF